MKTTWTDDEIVAELKARLSMGSVVLDVCRVPDDTVPGPGQLLEVVTSKVDPTDVRTFLVAVRGASSGYKSA